MIAAALVWLASYGAGYLFGYKSLTRGMTWLGACSYGIYLIYFSAFRIVKEATLRYLHATDQVYSSAVDPFLVVFSGVLIVVLAELNFRYIEEPLRRIGSERVRRKLAALSSCNRPASPQRNDKCLWPM